jgi:hypothetical protein
VSENAKDQPLEAKKYENVLDKDPHTPQKVLSFPISHHLVGSLFLGSHLQIRKFSCLGFPSTALNNVRSRELS